MSAVRGRLAHVGIFVRNRELMVKFYQDVLGLIVTDEGSTQAGQSLTFMSADPGEHHQVVLVTGRPEETDFNPINQVSFLVSSLPDLREVHAHAVPCATAARATLRPRQFRRTDFARYPGGMREGARVYAAGTFRAKNGSTNVRIA
jgi:catechol 2,3-dioxygenase-like lactoylglutathione lyase family enzyme